MKKLMLMMVAAAIVIMSGCDDDNNDYLYENTRISIATVHNPEESRFFLFDLDNGKRMYLPLDTITTLLN